MRLHEITRDCTSRYHAAWAWAGGAPFRFTKLVASDWGGTRTPMVVSWPGRVAPDRTPRRQFHHVNDVAPTVYELLGISPPEVVDGHAQDPIDGVSFAYAFDEIARDCTRLHEITRDYRRELRVHVRRRRRGRAEGDAVLRHRGQL